MKDEPDKKEWEVTIQWKSGKQSSYVFVGKEEEVRYDAYLSCPKGELKNVVVKPYMLE